MVKLSEMAAVQQVEKGKEAHDLKRKKVCVSSALRDVSGSSLPAETVIGRQKYAFLAG